MSLPTGTVRDAAGDASHAKVIDAHGHAQVVVPDAAFLLHAGYEHVGRDLVLTGDGRELVIHGFFNSDIPPALIAADTGARVTGALAARLAGPIAPGQYAQAGGAGSGAAEIGHVQTIEGTATARHADGTTTTLTQGAPVFAGDVVQTADGAKLGIVFVDKTTFALGADSRIVLDSMIYNPTTHEGSAAFSLLHGTFVAVTGEIGKLHHEAVQINTPVASIGIRGTGMAMKIADLGAQSIFTILSGAIQVATAVAAVLLDQPNLSTKSTGMNSTPTTPFLLPPQQHEALFGSVEAVSQALAPFSVNPGGEPRNAQPPTPSPAPTPTPLPTPSAPTPSVQPIQFLLLPFMIPAPPVPPGGAAGTETSHRDVAVLAMVPQETMETGGTPTPTGTSNGTSGADVLHFGGGVGTINGLEGNDVITYTAGDGNTTLDGGPGSDTLIVVGDPSAPNNITVAGNGPTITGTAPAAFTIDAVNVEHVTLFGGTGADMIDASASHVPVFISGGAGNDTLMGGMADDTLIGGTGADHMSGGPGNDVYTVDNAGDVVTEMPGQGNNSVYTMVDYALPTDVENLFLGPGMLTGTGNSGNNLISVADAANVQQPVQPGGRRHRRQRRGRERLQLGCATAQRRRLDRQHPARIHHRFLRHELFERLRQQ